MDVWELKNSLKIKNEFGKLDGGMGCLNIKEGS